MALLQLLLRRINNLQVVLGQNGGKIPPIARSCVKDGLNPPEWVEWIEEPVPGYPKRPVPRSEAAAKGLKKRTLTNLYNARPQWLTNAHTALDGAVAAAYGWDADISDDDALRELLALNSSGTVKDNLEAS